MTIALLSCFTSTSDSRMAFCVSEGLEDLGNNVDFLKKPKKAIKQAAQKAKAELVERARVSRILVRISRVIGSFWRGGLPRQRFMPRFTMVSSHIAKGLGRPASSCNSLIMFMYDGMLEGLRVLARNTIYPITVSFVAGTGHLPK